MRFSTAHKLSTPVTYAQPLAYSEAEFLTVLCWRDPYPSGPRRIREMLRTLRREIAYKADRLCLVSTLSFKCFDLAFCAILYAYHRSPAKRPRRRLVSPIQTCSFSSPRNTLHPHLQARKIPLASQQPVFSPQHVRCAMNQAVVWFTSRSR